MNTEQVLMALSNALVLVVMSSLTLAVGLGILSGLIWLYLKIGKWLLIQIARAYDEAIKPMNGKRVKA